jgi:hypothetical protein
METRNRILFEIASSENIIIDSTPPQLVSAAPVNNFSIDVFFDEAVDPTTAQNTANYFIDNGIGVPVSAQVDVINPSLVHLSLSGSISTGVDYTVTVNGVNDVFQNTIFQCFYQRQLSSSMEML